jgi:hypothetical protein
MKDRPLNRSNRPRRNEFARRKPNVKEVRNAQKLAKDVSKDLYEMMESKPVKDAA